ncbi:MAG: hypothetical protein Q8N05_05450 [Bacteroidota bacterium]|nr:hypothetical protein [Bacteroidota bacterium]
MSSEEKHCIWINQESGHPTMDLLSEFAEKVPIGGYVPCLVGTKKEIEKILRKLLRKPCLIEKYIKTIPE